MTLSARCNPFTERESAAQDERVLMAVRQKWFSNYEANRKKYLGFPGLDTLPLVNSAIVVGAGPTLKRNIDQLEGVKAPVIVADKVFRAVSRYVKPTVVVVVNTENPHIGEWLMADSTDVILVAPITADPRTFENWHGSVVFVNPDNTCPELTNLVQTETGLIPTYRGENVGMFGLITAITMGAKHVALLGMNYAFEEEEDALEATRDTHVVKIRSYTGEWCYTVLDWIDSRRILIEFCESMAGQCTVVNCSEGGILAQPGILDTLKFAIWRKHCDIQGRKE